MEELSDMIITKLVKMQAELDKAFFDEAHKNNIDIVVESAKIEEKSVQQIKSELEAELQKALDSELYELAQQIKKRLDMLN